MKESGLSSENLTIDEAIWPKLVRPLGYDGGIRSIERTLNSLCRKIALRIIEGKGSSYRIDEHNIKEFIEAY